MQTNIPSSIADAERMAFEAETERQKFRDARRAEIDAMRTCFDALHMLDADSKRRVMRWLEDGALYPPRPAADYDDEPPF